jgi:hypothetical protein
MNLSINGFTPIEETSFPDSHVPIVNAEKEALPNTNTPPKSPIGSPLKTVLKWPTHVKSLDIGKPTPPFPDKAKVPFLSSLKGPHAS